MTKAAKPRHAKPARRPQKAAEPNLIITIDERHRTLAAAAARALLARIGVRGHITRRPAQGLLGVRCETDPRACVGRLRALFEQDPLSFQHTHRWLPIEQWAAAEAAAVARFAKHAAGEIGPDESWRIRAERHASPLKVDGLVDALAYGIDNRHVDLQAADKTVLMEVIGRRAGMAVVREAEVLSVDQEMNKFVEFEEVR